MKKKHAFIKKKNVLVQRKYVLEQDEDALIQNKKIMMKKKISFDHGDFRLRRGQLVYANISIFPPLKSRRKYSEHLSRGKFFLHQFLG